MDMKLELLPIPVTDVDRAKAFYSEQVGFAVDFDHAPDDEMRMVQLTPPGSGCSIMVGTGTIDELCLSAGVATLEAAFLKLTDDAETS